MADGFDNCFRPVVHRRKILSLGNQTVAKVLILRQAVDGSGKFCGTFSSQIVLVGDHSQLFRLFLINGQIRSTRKLTACSLGL